MSNEDRDKERLVSAAVKSKYNTHKELLGLDSYDTFQRRARKGRTMDTFAKKFDVDLKNTNNQIPWHLLYKLNEYLPQITAYIQNYETLRSDFRIQEIVLESDLMENNGALDTLEDPDLNELLLDNIREIIPGQITPHVETSKKQLNSNWLDTLTHIKTAM